MPKCIMTGTRDKIVKIKAPKSGTERLELVLDPEWNIAPETSDGVLKKNFRHDDREAKSQQHFEIIESPSSHSASTAEMDNRSSSIEFHRTWSLESDAREYDNSPTDFECDALAQSSTVDSDDPPTDFEYDAFHTELGNRRGYRRDGSVESVDEEEEDYYYTEDECLENESFLRKGSIRDVGGRDDREEEVRARYRRNQNTEYDDGSQNSQFHVNNESCVIKDALISNVATYNQISSRVDLDDGVDERDPEEQDTNSTTAADMNRQEVIEGSATFENSMIEPGIVSGVHNQAECRRSVSFDGDFLSNSESYRSEERIKSPIRRQQSDDETSVSSVGWKVVTTTIKEEMTTAPILKRSTSPSILRQPRYVANVCENGNSNLSEMIVDRRKLENEQAKTPRTYLTSPTKGESMTRVQSREQSHTNIAMSRPQTQVPRGPEHIADERRRPIYEPLTRQQQPIQQTSDVPLGTHTDASIAYTPSGLSGYSEAMQSTAALDGSIKEPKKNRRILFRFRAKKNSDSDCSALNETKLTKPKSRLIPRLFRFKNKSSVVIDDDDHVGIATEENPITIVEPNSGQPAQQMGTEKNRPSLPLNHPSQSERTPENEVASSHDSVSSEQFHHLRYSPMEIPKKKPSPHPRHFFPNSVEVPQRRNRSTRMDAENPWARTGLDVTTHSESAPSEVSMQPNEERTPSFSNRSSDQMVCQNMAQPPLEESAPDFKTDPPDGSYNLNGSGMPSFRWWTWSQPDESDKQQQESRYCAFMCVFPPSAE